MNRRKRLGESGRLLKVDELFNQMCELCGDRFADESEPTTEAETDYRNLVQELVRLLGDEELFTFVLHPYFWAHLLRLSLVMSCFCHSYHDDS